MPVSSTARRLAAAAIALLSAAGCHAAANSGNSTPTVTSTTTPPSGGPVAAPPAATVDVPALVRRAEPSVVTVLTDKGLGSGIVYKPDGTIVTDAHVVADATQVKVAFADGQQVAAKVRASDPVSDVAVLETGRTAVTAATFQKNLPQVGAFVLAIGSPLGFEATVTSGIISGLHRNIPGSASSGAPLVDLIQTDAPISPGNSGGALIDAQGQ